MTKRQLVILLSDGMFQDRRLDTLEKVNQTSTHKIKQDL